MPGPRLQDRQHDVAGGAGVGRALQDDELPGAQRGGDLLGGLLDIRQVGVAAVVQRRGHADQQGVRLAKPPHVRGGHKALVGHVFGYPLGRNVLDVAAAGQELIDLVLINVEAHRLHAAGNEGPDQRQADVAQADDAHRCSLVLNCLFEGGFGHGLNRGRTDCQSVCASSVTDWQSVLRRCFLSCRRPYSVARTPLV